MSSGRARVVKLKMTPYFWRLLGKYCVVLSYLTVTRGGKRMSLTATVTGIVASHLLRHANWIEEQFNVIAKEILADQLTGFSADFIAAVATASSAQIPDVVRASRVPKYLTRILASTGPLRLFSRKPKRSVRRSSEESGEVRRGSIGPASTDDLRPPTDGGVDSRGIGPTQPGHTGLQPGHSTAIFDEAGLEALLERLRGEGGSNEGSGDTGG